MRILFLSTWFPYPPDNGSKIRAWHLLRALAQKHDVTLVSFVREDESREIAAVQSLCRLAAVVPRKSFRPARMRALLGFLSRTPRSVVDTYSRDMARQVRNLIQQSDFDVLVALEMGAGVYAPERPRAAVLDDFEIAAIRDKYRLAHNPFSKFRYGLTWLKARNHTRSVLRRFSACTVVSAPELEILKSIFPEYQAARVIPNGVDLESMRPNLLMAQPNTLIYSGALTFGANYDAMSYFLSEIWGRVRAAEPSASLQITGQSNGVDLKGLSLGSGVSLTGYLADIRPAVAGAWVCIVPLRIGGGTRLKILEAMALGTPVVATSKGAEGLEVIAEENILIADDPQQFAAQIIRLFRDPILRQRLSENGRKLVVEKYSWQRIGEQFDCLVQSAVETRGAR